MSLPRIAVLVDLPREAAAGGHVKYWERIAQAAAKENLPLDLTIYFSGTGADEILSPQARFKFLPPVFSTARLKFLPYVPAHTDLAPFHPKLAKELTQYDLIHTTDAFFAFARTAERIARQKNIPLVTSFHTDTPAYAELFTRQTLESLLGCKIGGALDDIFSISTHERAKKEGRLRKHLRGCAAVLALRGEDVALAEEIVTPDKINPMRLGVDTTLFAPSLAARADITQEYSIDANSFLVLFVGRVDVGKNMPVLMQACARAIKKGIKLHLLVAGLGPMCAEVKQKLGSNATIAGLVAPEKLAQFYAAADCLAIASDIEIGGMIGLEALSCGCPVLVSRQSGVAQVYGEPDAVQQVESGIAAWTEALTTLETDKSRQIELRAAAQSYREDALAGWNTVLNEDFIAVWQSLLQEKNNVR